MVISRVDELAEEFRQLRDRMAALEGRVLGGPLSGLAEAGELMAGLIFGPVRERLMRTVPEELR